jgi:hypothetical protein
VESGTAHLVHLFAYELQVPVVCVLVYKEKIIVFDFVGISQPKKALFGVPDLKSPVRFACEIVCRKFPTYK